MSEINLSKITSYFDKVLVREPVNDICKNITNNSSSKIILGGNRGSGKSVILKQLQSRNMDTNNQFIYMKFEPERLGILCSNKLLNNNLYKWKYGFDLCSNLLSYVKNYYGLLFNKYFLKYDELVHKYYKTLLDYINNYDYVSDTINFENELLELLYNIVKTMRLVLSTESLTIGIDRFDWINECEQIAQEVLSYYFGFFDKVVVTTDDSEVIDSENHEKLIENGYYYVDNDYVKDLNIFREIVLKRIRFYNVTNKKNVYFPEEILSDELNKTLFKASEGNLSLVLDALNFAIVNYIFSEEKNCHEFWVNRVIETASFARNLKRYGNQPKLYL